jgi:hypothetical protein
VSNEREDEREKRERNEVNEKRRSFYEPKSLNGFDEVILKKESVCFWDLSLFKY